MLEMTEKWRFVSRASALVTPFKVSPMQEKLHPGAYGLGLVYSDCKPWEEQLQVTRDQYSLRAAPITR